MLDIDIEGRFDNVYAASSFEHVGLGFKACGYHDLEADKKVAKKLADLTKDNGLFIISVPFGKNELFVHNEDGDVGKFGKVDNPSCGFRTYNIEGIMSLFNSFDIVKSKAYLKEIDKPDFSNDNPDSWKEISDKDFNNIKPNHASLCMALRKTS